MLLDFGADVDPCDGAQLFALEAASLASKGSQFAWSLRGMALGGTGDGVLAVSSIYGMPVPTSVSIRIFLVQRTPFLFSSGSWTR